VLLSLDEALSVVDADDDDEVGGGVVVDDVIISGHLTFNYQTIGRLHNDDNDNNNDDDDDDGNREQSMLREASGSTGVSRY
jgi:hypothetical protein